MHIPSLLSTVGASPSLRLRALPPRPMVVSGLGGALRFLECDAAVLLVVGIVDIRDGRYGSSCLKEQRSDRVLITESFVLDREVVKRK